MTLYVLNRLTPAFAWLPCAFSQNHLADLIGGIIFPSYINLLGYIVLGRPLVTNLVQTLALGIICCVAWEGIIPLVIDSIADVIDCACYVIGSVIHLIIIAFITCNFRE